MQIIKNLKSGYIFIPNQNSIPAYKVYYAGGEGVLAKLDPSLLNGYDYVTYSEYKSS